MPVDRNWTIPEDAERLPLVSYTEEGDIIIQPRVVSDDDPDALAESIFEAVAILRRVGGTIQIASQRGEIARNVVITESFIFAYNSFTPLVRRLDAQEAEQPAEGFPEDLEGPLADVVADAEAEVPAESEPVQAAGAVE